MPIKRKEIETNSIDAFRAVTFGAISNSDWGVVRVESGEDKRFKLVLLGSSDYEIEVMEERIRNMIHDLES